MTLSLCSRVRVVPSPRRRRQHVQPPPPPSLRYTVACSTSSPRQTLARSQSPRLAVCLSQSAAVAVYLRHAGPVDGHVRGTRSVREDLTPGRSHPSPPWSRPGRGCCLLRALTTATQYSATDRPAVGVLQVTDTAVHAVSNSAIRLYEMLA